MIPWEKWLHIENLNNEKNTRFFKQLLEENKMWVATEKIDGCNISLNITENDFQVNSRNNTLPPQNNFYNIHSNIPRLYDLITRIQNSVYMDMHRQITLFGEYFGQRVLNRIDYRRPYDFRFYAVACGDPTSDKYKHLSFNSFTHFMDRFGARQWIVPILKYDIFQNIIEYPNDKPSTFNSNEIMEGIVIVPLYDAVNSKYKAIYKNKNEKFLEKSTKQFDYKDMPKSLIDMLRDRFLDYCTESRMWSTISKVYEPTSRDQFKDFAPIFLKDAFEDFVKDLEEDYKYLLDNDKFEKTICHIGSKGYQLFTKCLMDLKKVPSVEPKAQSSTVKE